MATEQKSSGRVANFSAGPAALPLEALQVARDNILSYQGTGVGVMEMSHRSKEFEAIISGAERTLRTTMRIPDAYTVLFMQGGGTTQFSAIPLNLLGQSKTADYVITGSWSKAAAAEAARYCTVNIAASNAPSHTGIPPVESWKLSPDSAYVYVCYNETVHGVEFSDVPSIPQDRVLVADVSSCFLSAPLDITRFGLIYAGAQKNVGPAGVTIVIVRNDLLSRAKPQICPLMLNYETLAKKASMYNTPPCWNIYVTGLVFEWISRQGLDVLGKRNQEKAALLYQAIAQSQLYKCHIEEACRSRMNVVWRIKAQPGDAEEGNPEVEKAFVKEATAAGLIGLAGHRSVGGIRASLYNATTLDQCQQLVQFMQQFEQKRITAVGGSGKNKT